MVIFPSGRTTALPESSFSCHTSITSTSCSPIVYPTRFGSSLPFGGSDDLPESIGDPASGFLEPFCALRLFAENSTRTISNKITGCLPFSMLSFLKISVLFEYLIRQKLRQCGTEGLREC